jgi:hypothetical protein
LTTDPESQRFPVAAVDGRGRLYLAWIDKRQTAAAKREGKAFR